MTSLTSSMNQDWFRTRSSSISRKISSADSAPIHSLMYTDNHQQQYLHLPQFSFHNCAIYGRKGRGKDLYSEFPNLIGQLITLFHIHPDFLVQAIVVYCLDDSRGNQMGANYSMSANYSMRALLESFGGVHGVLKLFC